MTSRFKLIALSVPFLLASFAMPATAQSTNDSAQERINFSGKLRMLSQRIPSAACHFSRGIAVEGSSALLTAATAEFDQILTALEFGDADLNIQAAETRRKTLGQIETLRGLWEPFKAAATAIADGSASDEDVAYVLSENLSVLREAQLLVEELVKQYANPNAATRASLMLIDISGRQRMLTQKVSKETCMIGTAYATAQTPDDLAGTIRIFEASLEALRFGMDQVGIMPPPNSEIADGLNGVAQDWSVVQPTLTAILEEETVDTSAHAAKFQQLNTTMANMNTVVGMYTQAAK